MAKDEIQNQSFTKKSNESQEIKSVNDVAKLQDKITQLENDLLESERKRLGHFELTNDAIFIIDSNGNYLDVNQMAADLLGHNRHDMIGKSMLEFILKDEHDESKQSLEDLKAGKILPIYQRKFIKRDGTIFTAEINAAVVQDDEGKPAYIQSAVRDISERIKAEQALDRERKAYHLIAEALIYSLNLKDFCERCLAGLTKLLDFDNSTIRIYDSDSRMLIPIAQTDFKNEGLNLDIIPESIDSPHHVFALAARSKRVLIAPRFEDRTVLAPFKEKMAKMRIFSSITWPILDAKKELMGVLQLVSHKHREIPEEDLIFFEIVAHMFTVAFERKKGEETIRESEEKYRTFAQNFQGIAYLLKLNEEPIFYNGAVEEITGYTTEEMVAQEPKWDDIIFEDDRKKVINEFEQLLTGQCTLGNIEYRIVNKNGGLRWIHEIAQAICDEDGDPIWIQGAMYDISDEKRTQDIQATQRKLSNSLASTSNLTQALKLVLDVTSEMDVIDSGSVYVIDKKTGFLNLVASNNISQEYAEKIAYFATNSPFTQTILSGRPSYADFQDIDNEPDDSQNKKEGIHSLAIIPIISEGKIVANLFLASHTSGDIPVDTRSALETIASQIGGSIARIRAEEAFRESDQRYRTFVQNFQGIAYRTKENLEPIFYHGAVEKITGYTNEELLSRNPGWSDIVHPYDLPLLQKELEEIPKKKDDIYGMLEYRIITKNKEICWVQDIWQILQDEDDDLIGIQGSIHNINDRKQAQSEIEKLYDDLEKRVAERTEQLTLINKELTAFSYSVSHDLRTPLRHIGGFANLLQKRVESLEEKDERIPSYTQKIIDSVEEMNHLIDGLLTFSRMSRVEMVKIRINLTELVQDVLNDFQVELGNRQIDVSVNFLPDVIGDPSLLRLVLVNLISNSFKFTKIRDIAEITIGTMPSQDSEKITFFIRDNGVGFDMKYYDRLFGVFQRLHKNEEFEGTGIGLATVQRVIRRMGGTIWAEGEVDKGATFYFTVSKASELEDPLIE